MIGTIELVGLSQDLLFQYGYPAVLHSVVLLSIVEVVFLALKITVWIIIFAAFSLVVRRLHDTGLSGFWLLGFLGVLVGLEAVATAINGTIPLPLAQLMSGSYVVASIILGLVPSAIGKNRFDYGTSDFGSTVEQSGSDATGDDKRWFYVYKGSRKGPVGGSSVIGFVLIAIAAVVLYALGFRYLQPRFQSATMFGAIAVMIAGAYTVGKKGVWK